MNDRDEHSYPEVVWRLMAAREYINEANEGLSQMGDIKRAEQVFRLWSQLTLILGTMMPYARQA